MDYIFEILAVLFTALSGVCEAVQDTINFHFEKSIFKNKNPYLWKREASGNNKYKNNDPNQGPKFFGSTTFFVWTTDMWHRMKMIQFNSFIIALCLVFAIDSPYWVTILNVCALTIMKHVFFETSYEEFKLK